MTLIIFDRSGGAIGKDMHLELDLDTLPADETQTLLRLINETGFHNIPENSDENSMPDEFHYEITVHSGSGSHTIRTSDSTMPRELQPIIKELTMLKILQS
jgi:hypothetical protein